MLFTYNEDHGSSIAIICEDGQTCTYHQLEQEIKCYIQQNLITKGLMLLECRNDFQTIVCYLSALRANCPIFLVGEGNQLAIDNLQKNFDIKYIQRCNVDLQTFDINVEYHHDLAVILSTSGTTGTTKAIKLSKQNIVENAKSIIEYLMLTSADTSPTTLPFNYSYGLSVINSHLLCGGTIWLTNDSVMDDSFWAGFNKHACTGIAGVPHSYELMLTTGAFDTVIPSLRYATQSGGHLSPALVEKLVHISIQQKWDFFVMYGQTEATARMTFLPPEEAVKNLNCIGKAIPNGKLTLLHEGQPTSKFDTPGELMYEGPNIMMGYATSSDELTQGPQLTKLYTGDIACRNENGFFYIVGRKSRFVKCLGLRIGLDDVENWLFNQGVESAVVAKNEVLTVFISNAEIAESITKNILKWLKLPADFLIVKVINELPRLENGKINYTYLKTLAKEKITLFNALPTVVSNLFGRANDKPKSINQIFTLYFPELSINKKDSFESLGGDSLNYLQVSLELEKHISRLPEKWESLSIEQLQQLDTTITRFRSLDMQTLLRCAAIILIVCSHFKVLTYSGTGALTLLMVAGFNFSKFQLNQVVTQNTATPVFSIMFKVALLSSSYLLLTQIVFNHISLPALCFFSNYFGPEYNNGFTNWFIDIYMQMLIILFVLLSVPFIRQKIYKNAYITLLTMTLFLSLTIFVAPYYWDMSSLMDRVPHMLAWVFFFGMLANNSNSDTQKIITSAAFSIVLIFYMPDSFYKVILFYSALLLIWSSKIHIKVLYWVKSSISEVASASLFIYLSHFQFRSLSEKLFGENQYISFVVAIIGGILGWKLYSKLLLVIMKRRANPPSNSSYFKNLFNNNKS